MFNSDNIWWYDKSDFDEEFDSDDEVDSDDEKYDLLWMVIINVLHIPLLLL